MELITIRSQIKNVCIAWEMNYPRNTNQPTKDVILDKLQSLDLEVATKEDISGIIGNTSWAEAKPCDECAKLSDNLVEVGEPSDYYSNTAKICKECLLKALRLFDEVLQ